MTKTIASHEPIPCYKCNSMNNVSIKAKHKDGSIRLMICRDCRNKDHKDYQESKTPSSILRHNAMTRRIDSQWKEMAKKNHRDIVEFYQGKEGYFVSILKVEEN